YHKVLTFGCDTVRHFCSNSSEMKKTLRICYCLKCAILVFKNLLPEPYNTSVLKLLFLLCHWHGLAKLCMNTDDTLALMDSVTVKLGHHLQEFMAEMCPAFPTKELHREAEHQSWGTIWKYGGDPTASSHSEPSTNAGRRLKTFNLQTYKLHALGDYTAQIWAYGTTDSISTQPVHRLSSSSS
ncbi:hypothetical protein PAXINDRAFT_76356, partial [Paxillus involutus ATCC 200175]